MKLLEDYFKIQEEIYDYFGYKEDWVVIPLTNCIPYYWRLNGEGSGGEILYADIKKDLLDEEAGNYYSGTIYTQRFLPKWVYRGEDYTMVCMDTHCDGNKFLGIFDNKKEIN